MGINASPTCVLAYDGAVGYLIGRANEGMRYMFTMMNNARLPVGLEGLALGERAYQQAVAYAAERRKGGARGPGRRAVADRRPPRRAPDAAHHAGADRGAAVPGLPQRRVHRPGAVPPRTDGTWRQELADLLTPITKAWGTDLGVELTSLAVQVHGGMGYIEETGVAQHYRDARIAPIYEGTNGIQAMDLVGRKLPMRAGGVMNDFLDGIAATAEDLVASDGDLPAIGKHLAEARDAEADDRLAARQRTRRPGQRPRRATPYLRMCGIVTGGWLLARSAQAAVRGLDSGGGDNEFLHQKLVTARFYAEQLLPQAAGLAPAVMAGPDDLDEAAF